MTETQSLPQGPSGKNREGLADLVQQFAGPNADVYLQKFRKIQSVSRPLFVTFNWAAALVGPVWATARNMWGFFWLFTVIETLALVQIGRGMFGDLGAKLRDRSEAMQSRVDTLREGAAAALAKGDATAAETSSKLADNLSAAAARVAQEAQAAADAGLSIALIGLCILAVSRLAQGVFADNVYEMRFERWRADRTSQSGINSLSLAAGGLLYLIVVGLSTYRFVAREPNAFLTGSLDDKSAYNSASAWLDTFVEDIVSASAGVLNGMLFVIRNVLDGLEVAFTMTPWPIMFLAVTAIAWKVSGIRVAIFTVASLSYLAYLGFWEQSMATVALLGTAGVLAIILGLPVGIWCGRSPRAYAFIRPILDLMQTMPAFVYLIPVIAFFGTGKPPAVIATVIVAMPPLVRLTALGIMQVPSEFKEAAEAFGASRWMILTEVEIPVALPSIMTGVNQTILACLSMVVIASLIGAEGLGQSVLIALQYAAKGQGILAGVAILVSAMVIDRIVQGKFVRVG